MMWVSTPVLLVEESTNLLIASMSEPRQHCLFTQQTQEKSMEKAQAAEQIGQDFRQTYQIYRP